MCELHLPNLITRKKQKMTNTHHTQSAAIPSSWAKQDGGDFHVSVYKDGEPNSLIFAPTHNTMSLLDDCVYSATITGRTLIKNGTCDLFEVKYCYESSSNTWPHIKLKWEDTHE